MAGPVKAKKHLGQHFLRNEQIAIQIVNALDIDLNSKVLEIGPGDGVLSKHLLERFTDIQLLDIDDESIAYLKAEFPIHRDKVIHQDFLKLNISESVFVIGNFPYNISSQIVFKILENRVCVLGMVGMFQKEVAERIAAPPGSRTYGILSVLTQAFYKVDYLFSVDEHCFEPPPKVKSGVLKMMRKEQIELNCDERMFFSIVKRAFNQRRKMIRKSLKDLIPENGDKSIEDYLTMRPEQLGFEDFIVLTRALS
ncbi:MAG: 16S rRNA (adenine(1518)-N(6)/adenine(1519)-N(6))-dimethyltransferase RsmA [Salibacteraceae bacterium]